MKEERKKYIFGILLAILSSTISILQFLLLINIALDQVKFQTRMKGWLGLASIVLLGIGELSFVIFVFSYYTSPKPRSRFLFRFVATSAYQMLVFPLIDIIHFLVYLPVYRLNGQPILQLLTVKDYLFGGIGLLISVTLFFVLRRIVPKTQSRF